ncbi:MAG: TrkH family potassium uptake protein, partial [Streptococcus sanguinis]
MKHLFSRLSPAQKIILSFLLVIFCGSLLLSLPWVQTASSQAGYLDHLFTAVSM